MRQQHEKRAGQWSRPSLGPSAASLPVPAPPAGRPGRRWLWPPAAGVLPAQGRPATAQDLLYSQSSPAPRFSPSADPFMAQRKGARKGGSICRHRFSKHLLWNGPPQRKETAPRVTAGRRPPRVPARAGAAVSLRPAGPRRNRPPARCGRAGPPCDRWRCSGS